MYHVTYFTIVGSCLCDSVESGVVLVGDFGGFGIVFGVLIFGSIVGVEVDVLVVVGVRILVGAFVGARVGDGSIVGK